MPTGCILRAAAPTVAAIASAVVAVAAAAAVPAAAARALERSGGSEDALPLRGRIVVVDPGHNPGNADHAAEIAVLVDAGTLEKPCDTVGASSASGYAEAAHNLDVATRVRRLLQRDGAEVILTHTGTQPPWGPCITERAAIANRAGADVAISVHADGHAGDGRGYHVIRPPSVPGLTDDIAVASRRLARLLRDAYRTATGLPVASYTGVRGIDVRDDLGGLNLSDVPKVFLEAGNMRDPTDAALLESAAFRQREARGIARAIRAFLLREPVRAAQRTKCSRACGNGSDGSDESISRPSR